MRKHPRFRLFELLEPRILCATWQNADLPCDVDYSELVTPADALVVINSLNQQGSRSLSGNDRQAEEPWLDVNGDDRVSPMDALMVINAMHRNSQPLAVTADLAPSDDPNLNGVVLADQIRIRGSTSPLSRIRIHRIDHGDDTAMLVWQGWSDEKGSFEVSLVAQLGRNSVSVEVRDELGRKADQTKAWSRGDVVADWNATMLNSVRDWTGLSNDPYPNRIVPSRPPSVTRNLAMVHIAMFDALNATQGRYHPYLADLPEDESASPIAAMATAAHRIAIHLYPDRDETPVFDATLQASLALVPDGDAKLRGISLGQAVAQRMLSVRQRDGSTGTSTYSPTGLVGRWKRTEPDLTPPELPQWQDVKMFALNESLDLRVPPPPGLVTDEYAHALDEVMRLGRLDSTDRTEEQTEIAKFWADGAGTATPPGHWNRIASDVIMTSQLDLLDSARVLALLNMAMADAAIAAWRAKYEHDLWRPIDAIRNAALDDNPTTAAEPAWSPLLKTPAHPSYVSGHSTFSATAATVLTSLLGDAIWFSSSTDPQSGLTQRPLAPELITTRHFTSFWDAAQEAGRSRIYGGIHFPFDNEAGLKLGQLVGESIVTSWLQPRS
jgi:membrane-associated phospholipid phosphatase